MFEEHFHDVEKDPEVVHSRIRGRVVGHETPEEDEDEVLQPECHPVYGAPGHEVGHGAGEDACDENAEHEARDDDGESSSATVRRCEVSDEREHELRGYGCDGGDERDCCESSEVIGYAEAEPVLLC